MSKHNHRRETVSAVSNPCDKLGFFALLRMTDDRRVKHGNDSYR